MLLAALILAAFIKGGLILEPQHPTDMTHISPPPHTTHRPYVHSYARTHDTHRPTTQNTQAPHTPPLPDPLHIHILTMPYEKDSSLRYLTSSPGPWTMTLQVLMRLEFSCQMSMTPF